jgi:hypothetical protein
MTQVRPARIWIVPAVFAAFVAALWVFPEFWYTKQGGGQLHWFAENDLVQGWQFSETPIAKSAESALVGDKLVNGEFVNKGGRAVRVFSAKRYEEKANEIGLFMHTPDRCWTQIGWRVEASAPEVLELDLHGMRLPVERRIFVMGPHRELVYFAGVVGGEALPYRLDHHLSVAQRYQVKGGERTGAALRASDKHFWGRLWDSFANRRQLFGPKQFLRISTPLAGDVAAADKLLQEFLGQWLVPADYGAERASWKLAKAGGPKD